MLLDPIGHVAEFATANIFIVKDGVAHTPVPNDTFLNGRTGRVYRIFNARFLFFHFDFRSCAYFDYGNATSKFSHAFLQFFAIVIRSGFFNTRS